MASKTVRLRYDGKGTLTFQDASGARRTFHPGEVLEVDAATAETLLAGESAAVVSVGSAPAAPTAMPAGATPDPNAPPLTEASPAVSSSEAEPLAAPPPPGGTLPEPGPTEPASSATGAITLAELPPSAKKGGEKAKG